MAPGPAEVLDRARLDLLEGAAPDAVAAAAAGHDHVWQRVQAVVVVVAAAAAVEVEEGAAVGAGDAALPAGARGGEQQRELVAKGERLRAVPLWVLSSSQHCVKKENTKRSMKYKHIPHVHQALREQRKMHLMPLPTAPKICHFNCVHDFNKKQRKWKLIRTHYYVFYPFSKMEFAIKKKCLSFSMKTTNQSVLGVDIIRIFHIHILGVSMALLRCLNAFKSMKV